MNALADREMRLLAAPELVMPEHVQSILLYGFGVVTAILVLVAIGMSLRYKDGMPLTFLIAGACTSIPLDGLSDFLSHFTHAQIGTVSIYTAYCRVVPLFVFFIYAVYFGALYMYVYPRMRAGTLGPTFLWRLYGATVIFAYLFEVIPIHLGLWVYSDPQPIYVWKGTLPPHFAFLNAFSMIFGVVAMDKLRPILRGWRQLLLLIVGPIAPVMGHLGAGVPYYWSMNAGLPQWAVDIGGIATIGTCCLGVWLLLRLGYADGAGVEIRSTAGTAYAR
jgi:hypothetical protein